MADKSQVYGTLWRRFRQASEVDAVLQGLKDLKALQHAGELSERDTYGLQLAGFRALRELTVEKAHEGERLILEHLLPECLETHPGAAVEVHQLRECLVGWLSQYPDETVRHQLRAKVLDIVHRRLGSSDPVAACWVIAQIGYRTDKTVDLLWDIVTRNNNEEGDVALATLTNLGIPTKQRERILTELHRRAAIRYNGSLVSALVRLADPKSVQVAYHSWLAPSDGKPQGLDRSLVFNVFRAVLDTRSDEVAIQDTVWRLLADLVRERPDQFSHEFYLGHTAPVCNSVLVVPTMLGWLGQDAGKNREPTWGHYLIGLRLEECVRPRQLEGWANLHSAAAFEVLRHDACYNTGHDGFWTTAEDTAKKQAWRTLLRAGYADALGWFDEAVVREKGRFMQQSVIGWLSLFRFDSLPEAIVTWITERAELSPAERDSRDFVRRMAATRMARSSASREAFEALLDFGFTSEGRAMMPSVHALAEVALFLVKNGDTSVVGELVDAVIDREEDHQRVAAAYAIERIASDLPSLLLEHVERIISVIYETEREPVERGTLIGLLGNLEGWEIPEQLLQDMRGWAREPDRWLGGSSLQALARHGHLHNDHELLAEVLGLQQSGEQWDLAQDRERSEWAPYTVGLLYHYHPEIFAPAVASLIRDLEWLSVSQVFGWLTYTHSPPGQFEPAKIITDALIQRLRDRQRAPYAETETFEVSGTVAPQQLAKQEWAGHWDDWLPDSRVALADALGRAELDSDGRRQAISQLTLLAQDAQFAVRRAAYRGIARQSTDALHTLCLSWSEASTADLRQRAAEACGWLHPLSAQDGSTAVEDLIRDLATDTEPVVRDAAKRSWQDRRKRDWARQYLCVVRSVRGQSSREVLDAWRYGEALARTGDDSSITALREHLAENDDPRPPNVRYWIEQIIKNLEENWRKTTREWPDPWFAWPGAILEGKGKLHLSQREPIEIDYSIWSQPRAAPSQPPGFEWGGAFWPVPLRVQDRDDIRIELEDGRRGSILVSRVSGVTWIFLGTGPFPA